MNEMDDTLNQLFQDKPIAQESLRSFQDCVMNQILAHPVDFRAEILRTQRQKWGLFILSILLLTGVGILFTAWFAGAWLQPVVTPVKSIEIRRRNSLATVRFWDYRNCCDMDFI